MLKTTALDSDNTLKSIFASWVIYESIATQRLNFYWEANVLYPEYLPLDIYHISGGIDAISQNSNAHFLSCIAH